MSFRSVAIIGLFLLAACTPSADVVTTQTPEVIPTDASTSTHTPAFTSTSTETPTLTNTPLPTETLDPALAILIYGQKYMQERCSVCHSTERITSKSASREVWTSTVDRMIGKGAVLNSTERQTLIDFLSMSFP